MPIVTAKELLQAGAHFGHRSSRWNPKMAPYIYGKRNKIHIINLRETLRGVVEAAAFLRKVTREGRQVILVGTKRQAAGVVEREATRAGMPFVAQRWLGGTLTNLNVIRSRLRYLEGLEDIEKTGEIERYSKKAAAHHRREKRKVLRNLSGIRCLAGVPGALLVVDPRRERIAVREALRAGVPVVAIMDTDCDPTDIAVPIPANDDALRSVEILVTKLTDAIMQGKGEAATYVKPPEEAASGSGRVLAAASFGGDEDRRGRGRGRGGPGGGGGGGGQGRPRGPGRGGDRRSGASTLQSRERVRSNDATEHAAPGGGGSLPPREERSVPAPGGERAAAAGDSAEAGPAAGERKDARGERKG